MMESSSSGAKITPVGVDMHLPTVAKDREVRRTKIKTTIKTSPASKRSHSFVSPSRSQPSLVTILMTTRFDGPAGTSLIGSAGRFYISSVGCLGPVYGPAVSRMVLK
jgi:hypothetical protein